MMNIFHYIQEKKICAVVRVNNAQECIKVVDALYEGGIRIVEIILPPELQLQIIEKFSVKKDLAIIAGGIITAREAIAVMDKSVSAISSPVLQTNLIKLCHSRGVGIWCTVSTANEAYQAWRYRLPVMKLHPSDALGGPNYIKEVLKTMPFLNFVAAGGIKIEEIKNYIDAGALGVCIGRDFYKSGDFEIIKQQATKAVKTLAEI